MLAAGPSEQSEVGAPIVIVVKDAATVVAAREHVVGAAFRCFPEACGPHTNKARDANPRPTQHEPGETAHRETVRRALF